MQTAITSSVVTPSKAPLTARTAPPGAEVAVVPQDEFKAGETSEKLTLQHADETAKAQATSSDFGPKGLSKFILATAMLASAVPAFAAAASPASAAAAQTISTQLQQTDSQVLKVMVLPNNTPRLDLIREDGRSLSPVGVSLGNGLFQDTKGNLSVVPFLSYGWQVQAQDFQRVDLGQKGVDVQTFGNTTHYNESSTRRHIFISRENSVELRDNKDRTYFEKNADGSIHVKGPHRMDYTVRQEGLYTKVERAGQPDLTILRSGTELRIYEGESLIGAASGNDGQITIKSGDGRAVATRSENGSITEVKGSGTMSSTTIAQDGTLTTGRKDRDRIQINDPVRLAEARARYEQVIAQLNQVDPGFEAKHPETAAVLEYAAANPNLFLIGQKGADVEGAFLQGGTIFASVGAASNTMTALSGKAQALNLAASAKSLGAAALAAKAAAQSQAAAGNLVRAAQLGQEAQAFAAQANATKDQAIRVGGDALKSADVARVFAGVGGVLQIVNGVVGIRHGKQDRSLVQGAKAVAEAKLEQLVANSSGADKVEAQADYERIMKVMNLMERQANKEIKVGTMKIGLGGLMLVSAILGPEAPPALGAIGIAGTAGVAVYEHWGPIKSFLTGKSDKVPSFIDILPEQDQVVIDLGGVQIKPSGQK